MQHWVKLGQTASQVHRTLSVILDSLCLSSILNTINLHQIIACSDTNHNKGVNKEQICQQ